jgi:hypothetical protein
MVRLPVYWHHPNVAREHHQDQHDGMPNDTRGFQSFTSLWTATQSTLAASSSKPWYAWTSWMPDRERILWNKMQPSKQNLDNDIYMTNGGMARWSYKIRQHRTRCMYVRRCLSASSLSVIRYQIRLVYRSLS